MIRLRLMFVIFATWLAAVTVSPVVQADTYIYDGPSLARAQVGVATSSRSVSSQANTPAAWLVERSSGIRLASTTPIAPVVATNNASPVGEILRQDGVKIVIYSNDHAPPHAHVIGGGTETRIGQNGKRLSGDPQLTKKQQTVVDENLNTIRDAIGEYMRWYRENC